ncbi:MAG TPA: transglutaminase, partial [Alphaproteobacteria bacterium]|nr:transglutaminase [Alphaproteobacteria bacterium]
MVTRRGAILLWAALLPATTLAGTPDWLRTATQQSPKKYASDVNSVVLLDETETTVKDSGETISRVRKVIKVLRPEGREAAYQAVPFDDETKLSYFKGWSIS